MANTISNTDNVIDSREVIARIRNLEDERESIVGRLDELNQQLRESENPENQEYNVEELREEKIAVTEELEEWDVDYGDELINLRSVAEEGENITSDWRHGATLIHENYFTDYCQEMLEDIGDLPKELPSYIVIDWEATTNNLKHDYSTIDFDGETYYLRNE